MVLITLSLETWVTFNIPERIESHDSNIILNINTYMKNKEMAGLILLVMRAL